MKITYWSTLTVIAALALSHAGCTAQVGEDVDDVGAEDSALATTRTLRNVGFETTVRRRTTNGTYRLYPRFWHLEASRSPLPWVIEPGKPVAPNAPEAVQRDARRSLRVSIGSHEHAHARARQCWYGTADRPVGNRLFALSAFAKRMGGTGDQDLHLYFIAAGRHMSGGGYDTADPSRRAWQRVEVVARAPLHADSVCAAIGGSAWGGSSTYKWDRVRLRPVD